MSQKDTVTERILSGLAEQRWVLIPDFLDLSLCDELAQLVATRREAGAFKRAGIGKGQNFRLSTEIRSDWVCWLDGDRPDVTDIERCLLGKIDELRLALNQSLYLGLKDFEGHLTVYPEGGHYDRHVDRFSVDSARTVSVIMYLNRNWQRTEGGLLRIYDAHAHDTVLAEIVPEAGTMVAFMSADIPHEVTPSLRERMSVTGWFRN